jgi:DNA polymerase-3 subunit delta'
MTDPSANQAMPDWSTLIGHDKAKRWFGAAIGQGRLGGSFLIVGSAGIGKRTLAKLLARTLLCQSSHPSEMAPCGTCQACVQVHAGTHPDVVRVAKPADKSFIPLDLLIGPPDARMQEGFCREVRLKPQHGTRKVAILEDADFLNEEGANCLLKTLEEPPAGAVVLVIGTSEQRQLPTIRSRCQIIRLGPLSVQDATRLLQQVHGVQAGLSQVHDAIEISGGDMHIALRLLNQEADKFRESLSSQLRSDFPDPVALRRIISAHVDEAGKEPAKRRGAMRDAFSISVQHYRKLLRQQALRNDPDAVTLARLDRSVRALREVDRSANQSTLIECFAADIAAGTTADRGQIGS